MALSNFFFGSREKPASMATETIASPPRENNSFGSSTLPWTDSSPLGSPGTVSTLDSREND
jgi:hypothetical protein